MKAIYFDNTLSLRDIPEPQPHPGEALIKISAVGICNTDLEILKGYMSFRGIPGHEFCGVIIKSEDDHLINKRVVGEINIGCRECPACRTNLTRHCPNRTVLGIQGKDGAMAQFITLPIENLHTVPDNIADYDAVFIEPLAAACEILEQIHILPEHKIMILGDGKLAALIAQTLHIYNPNVFVKGLQHEKIQLLQSLGLHADSKPFGQRTWDLIIEATGNPEGFLLAIEYIKPRGTIMLKSTYNQKIAIDQNALVVNEINLLGSRCGNFKIAIHLLQQKLINVQPFISNIFPLSSFKEAFSQAQLPHNYKIILDLNINK